MFLFLKHDIITVSSPQQEAHKQYKSLPKGSQTNPAAACQPKNYQPGKRQAPWEDCRTRCASDSCLQEPPWLRSWHWKSHSQVYARKTSHTLTDALTRNSNAHIDYSTHAVLQTTGDWAVWSDHMAAFFCHFYQHFNCIPWLHKPTKIIREDGVKFRLVLCQRHTVQ